MTWEEIRQRKEDSIRETTGNPMSKSFEVNGKTYNSYTEYSNSDEYKEYLKAEEESQELYTQKAKEYFESFETDNQLLLFFHITNQIFENYFHGSGSYRSLLYDKFKFGPESYSLGCSSGMFNVHNAISTPDEIEERFQKFIKHMNLDLTKEELISAFNYFNHGFDNSSQLKSFISGQQKFNFDKE